MMKKIPGKSLNFRTQIYAAVMLVFVISVFMTIRSVDIRRNRPIISFVSEWSRRGKPVTARVIKAADTPAYTKFTVVIISGNSGKGFVTADIKDKIKVGQEVYLADGGAACGRISRLGGDLDVNTGMFAVEIEFDKPVAASGSMLVVFAQTQTLSQALVVPNSILDISGDNYYLWKIEDLKARRVPVKIGLRNGYGTVINEGIRSGDMVVFSGQGALKEGDKVNVIEDDPLQIRDEVRQR
ncbi:MAG: hypothetical protein WC559_00130 [Candidatus Omnitrophota bacterium]